MFTGQGVMTTNKSERVGGRAGKHPITGFVDKESCESRKAESF